MVFDLVRRQSYASRSAVVPTGSTGSRVQVPGSRGDFRVWIPGPSVFEVPGVRCSESPDVRVPSPGIELSLVFRIPVRNNGPTAERSGFWSHERPGGYAR